jgi:predicted secreted hydrolase
MDTGVILSRMATTEDATGHLTVVRDVTFKPDPNSIWQSPLTHNRYPLRWTIDIGNIELKTSGDVPDQEMPVLANKGAIWEGSVSAEATEGGKVINGAVPDGPVKLTPGVGYMELVGYGPNGRAPER